jgi:hypothetical protein
MELIVGLFVLTALAVGVTYLCEAAARGIVKLARLAFSRRSGQAPATPAGVADGERAA